MQAGNVYRPTEDITGRHRQLLTALADAALHHAKAIMQADLAAGNTHFMFCSSLYNDNVLYCRLCVCGGRCL